MHWLPGHCAWPPQSAARELRLRAAALAELFTQDPIGQRFLKPVDQLVVIVNGPVTPSTTDRSAHLNSIEKPMVGTRAGAASITASPSPPCAMAAGAKSVAPQRVWWLHRRGVET